MWNNFGRVLGEYPHIGKLAKSNRVEFFGLDHLQALRVGGFLIGAHIGNWEVGPLAALSVGKKVAAIYRPLNNPLLAGLLERRQKHYGGDIYRKGREAALGMVTAIRKKQVMCLLVDQQLREGMAVPFFGHTANTSISHIKIAIKKNVPIMFMRTERLDGCRFRVTISAPIALPQDISDDAVLGVATAINQELATWIAAQLTNGFGHRLGQRHLINMVQAAKTGDSRTSIGLRINLSGADLATVRAWILDADLSGRQHLYRMLPDAGHRQSGLGHWHVLAVLPIV